MIQMTKERQELLNRIAELKEICADPDKAGLKVFTSHAVLGLLEDLAFEQEQHAETKEANTRMAKTMNGLCDTLAKYDATSKLNKQTYGCTCEKEFRAIDAKASAGRMTNTTPHDYEG